MKEEDIIQAGIDYTLSHNPVCIAGDTFGNFSMTMNRNPSFEAGAKWMQEKMIEKAENSFCYTVCKGFREAKKCICDDICSDFLCFKKVINNEI